MDPLMLVQEMWNHAAAMKGAQAAKHMTWVTLSGQDLIDVAAYIQGRKSLPVASSQFSLPEPGSGKALFGARCAICHQGTLALDQRLSNMTLADVAAEMWNHAPRMMNAPILSPVEMRKIVAYVWERQYMGPAGDVGRGRAAFVQKSCASCHEGPAAVAIARGDRVFTPIKMVGAVWIHAPSMLKKMSTAGADWPKLSPEEMADLVAYMNTRP